MNRAQLACLLVVVAVLSGAASAQTSVATVTQDINITLAPAATIVTAPAVTLTHAPGNPWDPYTGSTTLTFRVRTGAAVGGSITVGAFGGTGEFSPVTPTSPSIAGGDLTFACASTTVGTCRVGTPAVLFGSVQNVVTNFPASTTTGGPAASVIINLSLVNKVAYKTGPYTATLTFTISAT